MQICDDFIKLKIASPKIREKFQSCARIECKRTHKWRLRYQFSSKNFGDDLNLLYVACTRSKQLLSVPEYLKTLLYAMDEMNLWVTNYGDKIENEENDGGKEENMDLPIFSEAKIGNIQEAFAVFDDIINELRNDLVVELSEDLVPLFFNGDKIDDCAT